MRFDHENERVYVRQSWLNDMVLCPNRARFAIAKPIRSDTDATIMGTAVHHGIESVLNGVPVEELPDLALTKFNELRQEPYKVTTIDPEMYETFIVSMCKAFADGILPLVESGGTTEMKFEYPLDMNIMGFDVYCEGTMDYVSPTGTIWDWKTSSRKYSAWDKQSQSIQATMYAGAVVHAGLTEFPVDFKYGVMLRTEKTTAQVVTLHRNYSHLNFIKNTLVLPSVRMAVLLGTDESWPMNDTTVLCSERWCDRWSICKGAYLTNGDIYPPKVDKN